jgi:glycosyltransferase involved in cell wall biosynthesis
MKLFAHKVQLVEFSKLVNRKQYDKQQKPTILFILHMPPPVHGAAMVGQIIKESSPINNDFKGTFINLSTSTEINEVGKGGGSKLITVIKIAAKVFKALLKEDYDLCYMTLTAKGFGYYKDFIIVTILKAFRKKIIYHFHNKGVSTRQNRIIDNLLYKFTFRATNTILLSSLLYYDIAKYVKRKDVFVRANGVPEPANKTGNKETLHGSDRSCKLLFLSNIVVEKGVFILLEACKLLKGKNLVFECNFVGDWSTIKENMFNQLVLENGLSNCVFAHGKKYNEDKLFFYRSSDIFVLPSINECFPLVLLEAMQFNLPVISTDEGGIADIIVDGETGFIVAKKDAGELADKLELLIKNADLRVKMGAAGGRRYKDNFTIGHFEKGLSTILKEIIYQNRCCPA